jgi:putative methionine-R-sulfoxide reductase with GAF domain
MVSPDKRLEYIPRKHRSHAPQPHADNSNFTAGVSKKDAYSQVIESMKALLEDQRNWVCNTANAASLLWHMYHSLPSPSSSVNWAGFYVVDPLKQEQLILGPFQGKVACQTITIGKGVCGTVAERGEGILLADVELFPSHIACDGDSKSEVVVPIFERGKVVGVIDIDCAEHGGFDEVDRDGLERLADLLGRGCDW